MSRNFLLLLALTTLTRCARQLRLLVPAREALVHGHLRHIGFELEFLNMKLNMGRRETPGRPAPKNPDV